MATVDKKVKTSLSDWCLEMLNNRTPISFVVTIKIIAIAFMAITTLVMSTASTNLVAQTDSSRIQPVARQAMLPSRNVSSRNRFQEPADDQPSPSDSAQDLDQDEPDMEEQEEDTSKDEDSRVTPQRDAFGPWPRKGIRGINVDVREQSFNVPEDRSEQLLYSGGSDWSSFHSTQKVFAWVAPDIRYQPLYFEDVALERYGQTTGPYRQSALSAVHMFKSFVLLPHQMRHDAPGSCDSPLGFCRPGNEVPYTIQRTYFGRPLR